MHYILYAYSSQKQTSESWKFHIHSCVNHILEFEVGDWVGGGGVGGGGEVAVHFIFKLKLKTNK